MFKRGNNKWEILLAKQDFNWMPYQWWAADWEVNRWNRSIGSGVEGVENGTL